MHPPPEKYQVYSVSQLNSEARALLEGSFPLIWVEGEISNLARPASGHLYFSLKDPRAQVRCAMFRSRNALVRFRPQAGDKVMIRARVSLYEGRGEFQLIAEHMEPAGAGAMQQAFEALKAKLNAEGLFDPALKQTLPAFPVRIGVITSPSGAAIRDIVTVVARRYPSAQLILYPAAVQGEQSPYELYSALQSANERAECDVLIIGRGGGSAEDLASFNDETLARAIRASAIPVVSAVGHEIDFTIADFVADQRAATPSAAAEAVTPDGNALIHSLEALSRRLSARLENNSRQLRLRLQHATRQLDALSPVAQLGSRMQRIDELGFRLNRAVELQLDTAGHRTAGAAVKLQHHSPAAYIRNRQDELATLGHRLEQAAGNRMSTNTHRLAGLAGRMHAISPLATLERGYAIVSDSRGQVITDSRQAPVGSNIQSRLAHGVLVSKVTGHLEKPDES